MAGETLVIIGLREFLIALAIHFVVMVSLVLFLFWRFRHMPTVDRLIAFAATKDAAIATAQQQAADAEARATANEAAAQSDAATNAKFDELNVPK